MERNEYDNLFELQEELKPQREYDYINEQGEKCKHTSRQWRLYDFYLFNDVKGKTRRQQQEMYEEILVSKGLGYYTKYAYGVLDLKDVKTYNDSHCAREFRKDLYAIKYSEVMQKVLTKSGFLTDKKELEEYAKSNLIDKLHELKLAWQIVRKAEKDGQMRIIFTPHEQDMIKAVKEENND